MDSFRRLLTARPPAVDSLAAWIDATRELRTGETTIDRAMIGGACADRLGFAFAAGYSEALRALVPDLDGVTALCITEAAGSQPKAIATTLVETAPGRFELTGHKKWATVGSLASTLLVAASTGVVEGTNRLRLVRVAANAPGVTIVSMTAAFVPEIPHAEVALDRVAVRAADVLPGDGYTTYVKPFRTVEDLHVHGALLGYLAGVTRRYSLAHELTEHVLALAAATRTLAGEDRAAPEVHVALAGVLALVTPAVAAVETAWATLGGDEWQRWQRDRVLLGVAAAARAARRDKAWSLLA